MRPGDVALLTGYAAWRPVQMEYAVEKGINVFMEKPFSPDPGGLKRMLRAGEEVSRTRGYEQRIMFSLPGFKQAYLVVGEEYTPVVPAETIVPELTPFALFWGLFYAALFSAACAYLGLKIGQVFEAAIPITILAIGLSNAFNKKDALQQNVMIQSIGSASGVVVAGAIFTLPGIYILGLADRTNFVQMCSASLLGGFLGILLLISFYKALTGEDDPDAPPHDDLGEAPAHDVLPSGTRPSESPMRTWTSSSRRLRATRSSSHSMAPGRNRSTTVEPPGSKPALWSPRPTGRSGE